MEGLVGGSVVQLDVSAARAMDAQRPPTGDQIRLAGRFIRECRLKLGDGHLMNRLRALGHDFLQERRRILPYPREFVKSGIIA